MPNSNFGNIQYKASNGLIKLDELEGIVECFVSGIGNKDSVGDICATGAFAKSLQRRKPRVVWGHNWNDPIGKVLEIYEVPASDPRLPMKMKMAGIGGLYAKVQFNLQSEKGKEAFANVAFFGEEQEWSIGYKTLRAQYDDNLQANVLYEVELYEVSPVLHGANQLTGTISVKSDEEKMHGMMPLVIGAPSAPEPRRDGIFDEGMSQRISGPQLAGVVAELSRRAGGPVMVVEATENSVVFVKPGKGKFRIGYHFTGSEYMFGKPELIHAEQPKPQMQSGPSPVPGVTAKPTPAQKPATTNPAMPMPVAVKPGNGGMVMIPLPQVEYDGMDKDKNKKPELVAEERELAESLVRIAKKYGKFDEDGDGIWAGYYPPAENKVKDIGVKCSNCVLYKGEGKCKILDMQVQDEGKCRFAIIPEGVVVGYGKKQYDDFLDEEEIKMVEDIEAKYPGEFILGTLRNTMKKRRKKRRAYKTLEEWGVEEQELMEKGLDPFLAQDSSYVLPVDPADAFEFKTMIDPVLEYHRIDTFINEYGVVIASQLDQESKDALETATKAAVRRLGRSLRSAGGGGNFLGRTLRGGRGLGVPSGDLDPRTRRDSNLDGTLFDNIPGWEQPDPTPGGPGSINNPKPSKRQLADAAKPDGKEKLSSGKRNLRRHADRSADMEKQFPNAEENQKRVDHEAIAKAWEDQGLGWEEVPRYNADKNLSSDYLRGREIGVNQARVMWDGDSVRKRPEKFNEKQKASQEYSNWYSSFAKSVSAYLDAHSRDNSDNWDGIESALRQSIKEKYPDTQDWAKEDIATLNEYLNDIGLLDVDKLKKKKKKKGGAEKEKGPDLQELRKLNSEGKLSSGYTNLQFSRDDLEKILDRFKQRPEFREWMEVQDELERRMRRSDLPRKRFVELDKEETRLDKIAMAARQQVIEELLYEGEISLLDEETPKKPSSPFDIDSDGRKLSSGKSPEYLKGREEGSKQIRTMWRGDSTNERPYKFDEKNNSSVAYRDWYWNTIRRAGAFLDASRGDDGELYNGMEDAIHEFMYTRMPDSTGFRGIGPDGENSLFEHMRQYGFDPSSPTPLRKQKDKNKRSSSRLSSGRKQTDREEMDAADESLKNLLDGFDGWDDEEWEFGNQLDAEVERWASANEDMPYINTSVEDMIDEMSSDDSIEGQNKLVFLENLQQALLDAQDRARMSDDERSRDRLERSVRRSQRDFDEGGILSSGKKPTNREIEKQEMDAADNSLRSFMNGFDGWDDEEWEFDNQLDGAVERWASSNQDMPWINTSVEEMIDEMDVDESVEGQNKLAFLKNLQQSLFDAQDRARMSDDERSRDRLERSVRRSQSDFDEGGILSSGMVEWTETEDGLEMDAPDIDGMYRINNEGNGKYSITRFSDIYRNGGQNALDEDIDRTFSSPSAAKRWAEKDYDKIVENMVRDEEYMQDSSRLSSGAIPDSARRKKRGSSYVSAEEPLREGAGIGDFIDDSNGEYRSSPSIEPWSSLTESEKKKARDYLLKRSEYSDYLGRIQQDGSTPEEIEDEFAAAHDELVKDNLRTLEKILDDVSGDYYDAAANSLKTNNPSLSENEIEKLLADSGISESDFINLFRKNMGGEELASLATDLEKMREQVADILKTPTPKRGRNRDNDGRLSSGAIPDSARQKRLIEAAEAASARKPDGTETFAASVARQYRKNGKLSEKQWSVLDKMFGASIPGDAPKTSASRGKIAPFSGKRRKIIDLADVPEYDYPNAPGGRMPTEEQSNAIDAMMTGDDVKISALAATGKTTTVINFAERLRDTEPEARALYLVFNANARDDAEKRGMPDNVRVMTMDAVSFRAMRTVNPEMTKKSFAREAGHIKPLRTFAERADYLGTRGTVEEGKELTAVDVYKRVAKAVDAFSVSDDTEFGPQHFNGAYNGGLKVEDPEVIAELLPFAKKMWEDMNTPRVAPKGGDRGKGMLPMNNTNLTKMWALTNPDIGNNEGINVAMVDEAQDMNPVFAGILRNSNSIQRIYIGDPNQAINAWRGADGKTLENAYAKYNMPITDSFRFGKNIADRGNRFLNLLGRQERMNGRKTDKSGRPVDGRIGSISNPTMILTRSNGGGIAATLDSFEKGRTVYGSKNFKDDLTSFIDNIEYMTNAATGRGYFTDGDGKQVFSKPKESQDLDGISTLEEFNKAIEKKDNNRLNMLGKILDKYSIEELREAMDRIIVDKAKLPKDRDAYVHIQTAHTSKGLESPRVLIWSDFRKPKKDSQGNWVLPDEQELRLSYVAVTRAEEELDLGSLGWIEQFESDVDPSTVRFSSGRNEFSPVAINAVSVEDDNSWMDRSAVGRGTTTASGGKWNGAKPARSDIKPGADLSGADLRRMVLSGANLAGANMEGADLTGADLTNARLIGVNLTGANLTNWQIAGADIFRAKLPKNWNGGNGAGSRMLPEGRLSSGMREFDELTDLEKQEVARNLEDAIVERFGGAKLDPVEDYGLRKFIDESGDYERGDSIMVIRDDYTDFLAEAARNGDWQTLEDHDADVTSLLNATPEAHPDYEMMLELDKDDREWDNMMSEMRGDLSSDGLSEDEVERVLDHWLYSSDSPKQEEYLQEYREPGDNYGDTFVRAARAMYQDHLERLYDNRQERNLSSGRRSAEQESRISDREVFERRMAGESLAETAKALGMKREEVRQAEMRHMARERGTLQTPDFDEIETYREDQARMAAEEAAELALNESIYTRRMGGESLAETAEALGMSREDVRTREQKHMQLMRSMDRQAKQWLEDNRDGVFSSGRKDYVSPLDDLEVGQRLSSGKLDEVYRSVQEKLIEQIEKIQESGDGKWEFPWHKTSLPKNVTNNNRPYSGINSVMLMFKQDAMGYEMPLWAGFNQWKNLGGTVRKGEKGTLILIPTILPKKKDADGNEIRGSGGVFFKTGHVFNIDQIDGIDKEQFRTPELPEEQRVAELEQALSEVGAVVNSGGDRAFYRPSTDEIHLPPFSSFKSREGYYAVFAHELMHWTGHPSRLNRDHLGEFGSPEYAQEELVAEIASAFFMAAHGLTPEPREDHAQYLTSWLKKLKSDPDAMKKAFGEAQKAHEYAISKSPSMSAKLGKKVAEAGVLPGNGDAGYGDIGPSLSSGRVGKYVMNPEGTTRTLADEMGAFGDELLTRFQMVRGSRDGDRHYFEDYADLGESRSVLGEQRAPNEWTITQGEDGKWSATLLRLEFGNGYTERDWAGVVSDEFDSPEDVAKWINDYENTRKAWTEKFKAETDFEKISSMIDEETARRDAEYDDSIRISSERSDRQQYARMMAEIDQSRLDWSAEDWADEAADIEMELSRENARLSSGVRSRHDETPVEEIGTVSNALKRTDEAGSNSRYIASRLAPVPADKYDFNSIRKNGESVSFTYGGKPRTIYPTGMMAKKGGGIYIVGLDDDANQYRSYSLHKIEGLIDGADAPFNPTQPGVPKGVPGSSSRRTRNVTSERLSSGKIRPLDEVRAEIEEDARYESIVVQDAFGGRLGTEKKGQFRVTIPLEDHAEAVQSLDRLVALRNDLLRSLLDGKRMPAGSYIFEVDKYAPVAEDELDLLMNIDDAVDRIHDELRRREEQFSELKDEIDDMKDSISELEDAFRTTRRMGARSIPGPVDFESAMERNIDMADGDDKYAIRLIESDADSIIEVLEKIDDTEDRFGDTHGEQIAEIKELIDSADRGDLTPQEFASKLGDLYYKNVNGLEGELSDLFNIQERFENNGVTPDREDITGAPEDVFSSSNLSNFDMIEGDAEGFSSGRRNRTQGSKRRPMSDADRRAFADGVRQRAATIPGKRRPGPSKDEFDNGKLSSGRLYFPSELERNKVGRDLEDNVKIKFGRMSENNDRTPDGKWMLDASKLKQLLRDEDGKKLSNEESAKFLGISMREFEKMLQDGAGISETDAYTFIDQAFTGGTNPAGVADIMEAIWGFDSVPYWYDSRRGNLLTRAEYEDYKEEGIQMDGELVPRDFDAVEKVVASEISKNAFPLSALSESLGAQSDDDLVKAITFEVDGEQIVTTPKQLAKWRKEGVPTAIIEQLVDRGIIPSAGDVFGEEGIKFDNSIRQFDLWKNISDAIARNGKKVKGIDLDEIIGATKVQTRLRAFEEGKEGRFSKNTGKALRYSDEEVQEIVDRLNKKYGLSETVESIKGEGSLSSGRRAARRISNTGQEAVERLSSGRENNGAPENITPRMQNEIMRWAQNATWSTFAKSVVAQFRAQGFLSRAQWIRLLQLHDNSQRRR